MSDRYVLIWKNTDVIHVRLNKYDVLRLLKFVHGLMVRKFHPNEAFTD